MRRSTVLSASALFLCAVIPHSWSAPAAVATIGSEQVSSTDLDQIVELRLKRLRAEEFNIRRRALDELIAKKLIEREAAARKITVEELRRIEVKEKAAAPTTEEIERMLDSAGERFQNMPRDQAIVEIGAGLSRKNQAARESAFFRELKTKYNVKILLDAPRVTVSTVGAASQGPASARVTLVEFSDYQCPFCGKANAALKDAQVKYSKDLRVVFKHFPLPMHKQAPKASEAAECAGKQGKFWEMNDALFANQTALDVPNLKKHATTLALDQAAFDACLDSGETASKWQQDLKEGQELGVSSMPSFFINGRTVSAGSPESLHLAIDEELERAAQR